MKLRRRFVEKPWGRTHLPATFDAPADTRIGEVWFEDSADLPLLAKYIFTSERLSIQVHPNDEEARARGHPRGKTEWWYILDAEPGSTLGLGLKRELTPTQLRGAALDGSIEKQLDWCPVEAGDFFLVPAGTIHAIGGGLSLLEFQQNSDVTYRLYDYGRPRELHIDDAVAVATSQPYPASCAGHLLAGEEHALVEGPIFDLVHSREDQLRDRQRWIIPLEGKVRSGDDIAVPGGCLLLEPGAELECEGARMLIGAKA